MPPGLVIVLLSLLLGLQPITTDLYLPARPARLRVLAPLPLGVWFWSALIALAAWTLVQQQGQHDER